MTLEEEEKKEGRYNWVCAEFLRKYAHDWIIDIEDISDFVKEQYEFVKAGSIEQLTTPRECVYPVTDKNIVKKLELSRSPE